MKYLYLFIFCFLLGHDCFGQQWIWARRAICENVIEAQEPSGFALDRYNHYLYSTGSWGYGFRPDSIRFGSYSAVDTLGGAGVFLVKYDTLGNPVWLRTFLSDTGGLGTYSRVAVDKYGYVYIAGYFSGDSLFGNGVSLLNPTGWLFGLSSFLVKFSPTGDVVWYKGIAGDTSSFILDVNTDRAGNVYVMGKSGSSKVIFGNDTLANAVISGTFVFKYDTSGNLKWSKFGNGYNAIYWGSIIADNNDGVYMVNEYYNDSSFIYGADTILPIVSNVGNSFIVKYDTSGNVLWAKALGNNGIFTTSIAIDENNNPYLTGNFGDSTHVIGNNSVSAIAGSYDFFLCKLNSLGDFKWVKTAGTIGFDSGNDVCIDSAGHVVVNGGLNVSQLGIPTMHFDTVNITQPVYTEDAMFIVYYDTLGHAIGGTVAKSGGDDYCGMVSDYHGNLYFSGDYYYVPKFILGHDTLDLTCQEQFFIAKYATGLAYHVDTTTPIDTPNNIQNIANQSKLLVYPNPNNGTFTISANLPSSQSMAFELRDVRGATIYKTNLYLANGTLKKEISLRALPPGLYMYTYLTNTGESGSGKLVIQKE